MNPELLSLRKKLVREAKKRVQEDIRQSDVHIVRAVNALTDLDATANLLAENAKEWYQTAFPELERIVDNQDVLLKLAFEIGNATGFSEKKVKEFVADEGTVQKIVAAAQNTSGTAVDAATLQKIQAICEQTLKLRQERKELEV